MVQPIRVSKTALGKRARESSFVTSLNEENRLVSDNKSGNIQKKVTGMTGFISL